LGILITGLAALSFFILGFFIRRGKGLMLIAGYNTMPKHERHKVDKKELSKKTGNLLFRMALALFLSGVAFHFKLNWAAEALILIMIADACVTAIRMSRGYKHNAKMSKGGLIVVIVTAVIIIIAVVLMLHDGEKDPVVSISQSQIQIEAMYGLDIKWSDIEDISLIDQPMDEIEPCMQKDNGYGGFGTLKGHFSSNSGQFMLFVNADSSPTIRISRKDKEDIYISFGNKEKTLALYQQLIENRL